MKSSVVKIYCDGGARGNPGNASSAFAVVDNGKVVYRKARYLGVNTNNYAEYCGLYDALLWLKKNKGEFNDKSFQFFLDSELVVKQINGRYKVRSKNLKNIFREVIEIRDSIKDKIKITAVRRERNRLADSLVNECLDENE